jgi:hypothetical protein
VPRERPPGIWESLKRALGGGNTRPDPNPVRTTPEPPSVSPPGESFAPPPFLAVEEPAPEPVRPSPPPAAGDVRVPDAAVPSPAAAAPEAADAPDRPRLARGLASFSRSNADREKKFAHLLRDDSPGPKNR